MQTPKKKKRNLNGLDLGVRFGSKAEEKFVRDQCRAISEALRALRKRKGYSQEKLAEEASISVATVKFIEQNQRLASLPMLFKLLYVLARDAKIFQEGYSQLT